MSHFYTASFIVSVFVRYLYLDRKNFVIYTLAANRDPWHQHKKLRNNEASLWSEAAIENSCLASAFIRGETFYPH